MKYLGRSGVVTVGGLLVAFLDGQYNAAAFRTQEPTGTSSVGPGCRYYAESGAPRWPAGMPCMHPGCTDRQYQTSSRGALGSLPGRTARRALYS